MESYYQSLHINKELQLVPLWALASSDSCSTAECGLFEMETQIEIERLILLVLSATLWENNISDIYSLYRTRKRKV